MRSAPQIPAQSVAEAPIEGAGAERPGGGDGGGGPMRYPSARAPTLFPRLAVNILFASEPYFHELVFLLQFAAAAALISQNYGCEIAARISPTLVR